MKPGIFRSLCSLAKEDPDNEYVLVIDEINRGNIAKLFGELMTLLEADKRGKHSVELPYRKEVFQVPDNLTIIGTMNTADRSIALMDVALRRRFAFMELMPDPTILAETNINIANEDSLNVSKMLELLNQRIKQLRGPDYQVGHSYFMPLRNISDDLERLYCFEDIWNYQVIPLIKEYFYGQSDSLRQLLPSFFEQVDGDGMEASEGLMILRGEDLIAALNMLSI